MSQSVFRSLRSMRTSSLNPIRSFSSTPSQNLAKISLIGRLGTEPELKTTNNGTDYIRYVIGAETGSRDAQGKRNVSWFKVTNFNVPDGSKARDYFMGLEKGTLVYVEGEASLSTYQDQDTSKSHNSLNIVQRSLEVLKRPSPRSEEGFESDPAAAAGGAA